MGGRKAFVDLRRFPHKLEKIAREMESRGRTVPTKIYRKIKSLKVDHSKHEAEKTDKYWQRAFEMHRHNPDELEAHAKRLEKKGHAVPARIKKEIAHRVEQHFNDTLYEFREQWQQAFETFKDNPFELKRLELRFDQHGWEVPSKIREEVNHRIDERWNSEFMAHRESPGKLQQMVVSMESKGYSVSDEIKQHIHRIVSAFEERQKKERETVWEQITSSPRIHYSPSFLTEASWFCLVLLL